MGGLSSLLIEFINHIPLTIGQQLLKDSLIIPFTLLEEAALSRKMWLYMPIEIAEMWLRDWALPFALIQQIDVTNISN